MDEKKEIVDRRFFSVTRGMSSEVDHYVHDLDYDLENMVALDDRVYVYLVKRDFV